MIALRASSVFLTFSLLFALGCGDDDGMSMHEHDAQQPDAAPDAPVPDAAPDAAPDATVDATVDANAPDAAPDASVMDASLDASPDAMSMDGSTCNLEAIGRIPRTSEPVMAGTYCDALYACAPDRAAAARIMATSIRFRCMLGTEPASGCSGYTCVYMDPAGRGPLDADDLMSICPVTVMDPMPMMRCVVFL